MKKNFILIFFIIIFLNSSSLSHVSHYKNIKLLKYGLFLNDQLIGTHIFKFSKANDILMVKTKGFFKVDKFGVTLMNYQNESQEYYKNDKLIKFRSKTKQNDKEKYVNIDINEKKVVIIDGSSYKGEIDNNFIIGSWWNHQIIKNSKQISPISGRIIHQKVNFLGKKKVLVNEKEYNALSFHFLSDDDKPINKKKLNMKIWYDAKTLLWIKASYEKLGTWEYRLLEAV